MKPSNLGPNPGRIWRCWVLSGASKRRKEKEKRQSQTSQAAASVKDKRASVKDKRAAAKPTDELQTAPIQLQTAPILLKTAPNPPIELSSQVHSHSDNHPYDHLLTKSPHSNQHSPHPRRAGQCQAGRYRTGRGNLRGDGTAYGVYGVRWRDKELAMKYKSTSTPELIPT